MMISKIQIFLEDTVWFSNNAILKILFIPLSSNVCLVFKVDNKSLSPEMETWEKEEA